MSKNVHDVTFFFFEACLCVLKFFGIFYVLVFVEFDLKGSYHVYEGIWVAKVWENLQITNQRGPRGGPNLWAKVVPSWQHTVSMFTDYFTASCVDHGP